MQNCRTFRVRKRRMRSVGVVSTTVLNFSERFEMEWRKPDETYSCNSWDDDARNCFVHDGAGQPGSGTGRNRERLREREWLRKRHRLHAGLLQEPPRFLAGPVVRRLLRGFPQRRAAARDADP